MKKTLRVCLLIGLILSIIIYIYLAASSFIAAIAVFSLFGAGGGETVTGAILNMAGIIALGALIIPLVIAVLGAIFSGVSFKRVTMQPSKFEENKGKLITVIVFNIITVAIFVYGLIQEFNVLSLLSAIALVAGVVLIAIDMKRNKNYWQSNLNKQTQKMLLQQKTQIWKIREQLLPPIHHKPQQKKQTAHNKITKNKKKGAGSPFSVF